MSRIKYKRVLLKLSGEVFGDDNGKGISFCSYERMSKEIIEVKKRVDIELVIVVGAGNIFRGREAEGSEVDEVVADYMGILATVINGLGFQESMERLGIATRLMTGVEIKQVAEPFIRRRAIRHLEKGRVVILAGGTGSPFFTTDSAAALRACELSCDVILKASTVDGIYDKDPKKHSEARKFGRISYQEALEKRLMVMDNTAFALCQRKKKPIIVFDGERLELIEKIVKGEKIGSLVS